MQCLLVLGTQRTPQLGATIYLHHLTQTYYYCLKATHSTLWSPQCRQVHVHFPKTEVSVQQSVLLVVYSGGIEKAF